MKTALCVRHIRRSPAWARAVASGEIPEWVAARRYVAIGSGDSELQKQPWEHLYILSFPLTALCILASLAFILRSSIAALRGRTATSVIELKFHPDKRTG